MLDLSASCQLQSCTHHRSYLTFFSRCHVSTISFIVINGGASMVRLVSGPHNSTTKTGVSYQMEWRAYGRARRGSTSARRHRVWSRRKPRCQRRGKAGRPVAAVDARKTSCLRCQMLRMG